MRTMWIVTVLPWLMQPAHACKCVTSFSTCNSVSMAGRIFIGTVESVQPTFLSRFDQSHRTTLPSLNEAYAEAQERPSPESLARVKEAFAKVAPTLPTAEEKRLEAAKTPLEVASLFNSLVYQGIRVRLRVKSFLKQGEDDDDAPKDKDKPVKLGNPDKPPSKDLVDVWTAFGDCGVDFQEGETYLVYADEDEGTNQLFSDKCSRTRRLSDAGEDLAYLHFYKEAKSSRLEGFATTDRHILLDYGQMPETVNQAVAGLVIELRSSAFTRFTETDANGRYVFDGLPADDYKIKAFPSGYVVSTQPVAGPYTLQIKDKDCARQLLLVSH